jgi:autotransporter-associated beta strand protein
VVLAGNMQPRSIVVANSGAAYTLSGTGAITGATSLSKTGTGTLNISPAWFSLASTSTTGTPLVSVPSTAGLVVGMTVAGIGIPAGSKILEIVDATQVKLSQNATTSATGAAFSYFTTHTFSGGTTIGAGSTIALTNHAANSHGLGTGAVTFMGGTLSMFDAGLGNFTGPLPNDLIVGTSGTLRAAPRCGLTGSLSGAGVLNFYTPYVRADVTGDWSPFTGQINVITDSDGGDFRFGTSYSYPGFPNASLHLNDKTAAYYLGILATGAGTMIEIGEVTGTSGARLSGGGVTGRGLTYRIGGKTSAAGEAVFAGTISEQIPTTSTSYVKTGPGTWRLSGTAVYNGSTTVEEGRLRISGSLTSGGSNFLVQDGAALDLVGGTVNTADLQIAAQGTLTGQGTLVGDLTNAGTVLCESGVLNVTGAIVNNGTMRFTGGAALVASGSFVNNGVLDLLRGAQQLPADFQNNGIVIDSSSLSQVKADLEGTTVTLKLQTYSGHRYQLQRADSLTNPGWTNVGQSQAGDGTVRTFIDPAANGRQRFYRVQISS